ncbi:ATP-binding protein [Streptacidiphilus sp. N1-3]|uniref:ATP-binding protein n=1 Tax=Streptacidiphilus alkalitolerans TaxID=3342712 RepID=A0ABV6XBC5_9ACTN
MGQVSTSLVDSEDVAWFRDELTAARGAAAALARRTGLDEARCAEVALAVSEVATNLDKHARDGALLLRVLRTPLRAGVEVVALDQGPGIADVAEAMRDGNSSTGTLGIGLGAVGRLADTFDIYSLPGRGTVLAAGFWSRTGADGGPRGRSGVAGLTRPMNGEQVCGDAWSTRLDDDGSAVLVMLCDGLGHGPMAALAGQAAAQAFRTGRARSPEDAVQEIHRALRGTRGAVVAVARIEPERERLLFCGIGNIAAALISADTRATLVSSPGIVGHQMRTLRTFEHPLPRDGALVLHSDGLSERWSPRDLPGLLQHPPVVIAAQLLRHAGTHRDDAAVVVARGQW